MSDGVFRYFVDGVEVDSRGRLWLCMTDTYGSQHVKNFSPHLLHALMISKGLCRDPRDEGLDITRIINTNLTQEEIDSL